MNKEDYIKYTKKNLKGNPRKIMLDVIDTFYRTQEQYKALEHNYEKGSKVFLKKGTLLHGTYMNLDGLKIIAKEGLLSSWFTGSRVSKYPSSVGVWNLKQDYYLSDYIKFYSGGTIRYSNMDNSNKNKTEVIPFDKMNNNG